MLVQSEYKAATNEVNKQCTELNKIIKKYDSSAMLIGEAPCTKDLITITDKDFKVVSAISIIAVFLIIAFVFKSVSSSGDPCGSHRICNIYQPRNSVLYRNQNAVYRINRNRYDPTGCNRRLCDPDDNTL